MRVLGSSPLTRGKLVDAVAGTVGEGLIPAHAGKTSGRASRVSTRRAHPRSRGENDSTAHALARLRGSSPLTRGKPRARSVAGWRRGLIPAHAGKTRVFGEYNVFDGAHPRSRGENGL